jgi:hypothetical protein
VLHPQRKKISFYNDYVEGTCGVLDRNNTRTRKGDFAMRILSFVEAGDNTGYFCNIKRQMDGLERYAWCDILSLNEAPFIVSTASTFIQSFHLQLNIHT